MKRRLVAAVVFGVLIFGGLTAAAILLPSTCPTATHTAGVVCLSDGRHPAPSTPSRTIPDYSTSKDPRTALRLFIMLVGLMLASGLVWLARMDHPASTERLAG